MRWVKDVMKDLVLRECKEEFTIIKVRKADIRADMMREIRISVCAPVIWGCLLDIQADVSCWQLDV